MEFNEGDIIVGKPESDFRYNMTNSHTLMKVMECLGGGFVVVNVIETDYNRENISASTREHAVIPSWLMKKDFFVEAKYFKLADNYDKAKFLMWRI